MEEVREREQMMRKKSKLMKVWMKKRIKLEI
jgi:hypothetical protein